MGTERGSLFEKAVLGKCLDMANTQNNNHVYCNTQLSQTLTQHEHGASADTNKNRNKTLIDIGFMNYKVAQGKKQNIATRRE
jgi:hypothetical protein